MGSNCIEIQEISLSRYHGGIVPLIFRLNELREDELADSISKVNSASVELCEGPLDLILLIVDDRIRNRRDKVRVVMGAVERSGVSAPVMTVLIRGRDTLDVAREIERSPKSLGVLLADPLSERLGIGGSYKKYAEEVVKRIGPILEIGSPGTVSYAGASWDDLLEVMTGERGRDPLGTVGYSTISTICDDLRLVYRGGVEEMLSNLLARADLSGLEDSRILVILRGPGERLMVTYTEQLLRRRFDGWVVRVVDISKEGEVPVELIGLVTNIPPERFGVKGAIDQRRPESGDAGETRDWRKLKPVEVAQEAHAR